jgi:hypothetical protein
MKLMSIGPRERRDVARWPVSKYLILLGLGCLTFPSFLQWPIAARL